MGLSFSGGLALIAAANPAYQADFKFVLAVGAQDSMARVAEYYRTGRDPRPNGPVEVLTPHTYGPLVLEYEYVEDFVPAADVPAIRGVLRANLYEDPQAEKTTLAALTPEQRAEATSLMNVSLDSTQMILRRSRLMDCWRICRPRYICFTARLTISSLPRRRYGWRRSCRLPH
jgi:hypothetical protein